MKTMHLWLSYTYKRNKTLSFSVLLSNQVKCCFAFLSFKRVSEWMSQRCRSQQQYVVHSHLFHHLFSYFTRELIMFLWFIHPNLKREGIVFLSHYSTILDISNHRTKFLDRHICPWHFIICICQSSTFQSVINMFIAHNSFVIFVRGIDMVGELLSCAFDLIKAFWDHVCVCILTSIFQ